MLKDSTASGDADDRMHFLHSAEEELLFVKEPSRRVWNLRRRHENRALEELLSSTKKKNIKFNSENLLIVIYLHIIRKSFDL